MVKHTIQDSTGTKVSETHELKDSLRCFLFRDHRQFLSICLLTKALLIQYRFIVIHVEFTGGCLRRFDSRGQEIEANFGQTSLVRTGYLHSSYSESGTHYNL